MFEMQNDDIANETKNTSTQIVCTGNKTNINKFIKQCTFHPFIACLVLACLLPLI